MLEPSGTAEMDLHLETMTHAVIELDVVPRTYGKERRRLRVVKMREFEYVSGYHDYELTRTGLRIYPRVVTRPDNQQSGNAFRRALQAERRAYYVRSGAGRALGSGSWSAARACSRYKGADVRREAASKRATLGLGISGLLPDGRPHVREFSFG